MTTNDRRKLHERKTAALADRISEPTREYTAEELARLVKAARASGQMPTVEQAAMDAGAVLDWWE